MGGPWEEYQNNPAPVEVNIAPEPGPWEEYQSQPASPSPDMGTVGPGAVADTATPETPPNTRDALIAQYHAGSLDPRKKEIVDELAKRGEIDLGQPDKGFIEGVAGDFSKRSENVQRMIERRSPSGDTGMIEALGQISVDLPAQAALAGGQVAGAISDVATQGIKSAYTNLVPEGTQESIAEGAKKVLATEIGQYGMKALQEGGEIWGHFKKAYPDAAMALEGLGNVTAVGGMVSTGQAVGRAGQAVSSGGKEMVNAAGDVARVITKPLPAELDKKISSIVASGYGKGIRPTVVGKKTFNAATKAKTRADEAVKEIVGLKDDLIYTAEDGSKIAGGLPGNLNQFSEAIGQAKGKIYQTYSQMAKEAGEQGAAFDTTPIVKKLAAASEDLKNNPQVRKYAESMLDEIVELKGQPPEVIEARIADLNRSLNGFYEGRVGQAKAQVDASVASLMREELDRNITSAMGSGYQSLKNRYGALASIEKEVQHRATVFGRQNKKGLADFSDIFTGAEILGGTASVLSGNPGGWKSIFTGLGGRAIKNRIKSTNNPDNIVKNMFSEVDKLLSSGQPKSQLFKNMEKLESLKKFDPSNPLDFPPGGGIPTGQ